MIHINKLMLLGLMSYGITLFATAPSNLEDKYRQECIESWKKRRRTIIHWNIE